jgi:1,4-alpha-glucan branching enzyme
MITKKYSKTGKSCRVTFKFTPETEAVEKVILLGEFNDWGDKGHEMVKRKAGHYSVSVQLDAEKDYQFRYLINDQDWSNGEGADNFVANTFGTKNAVLSL